MDTEPPTRHQLKILPEFFDAVVDGSKTCEVRYNDRDFQVGDILYLNYHNPDAKDFSYEKFVDKCIIKRITHILSGEQWGIRDGYVVLSIADKD
jgi:hypothetical protein